MRKHRLDKVGVVAKGKVDTAASRLRDALRSEQAEQTRLEQLTEFSREYDQFLERRDADTLSPRQLEEYRRFMHRLHVAVNLSHLIHHHLYILLLLCLSGRHCQSTNNNLED